MNDAMFFVGIITAVVFGSTLNIVTAMLFGCSIPALLSGQDIALKDCGETADRDDAPQTNPDFVIEKNLMFVSTDEIL